MTTCRKCDAVSGDSWWQCEGSCPMPMSPYYEGVKRNEVDVTTMVDQAQGVKRFLNINNGTERQVNAT